MRTTWAAGPAAQPVEQYASDAWNEVTKTAESMAHDLTVLMNEVNDIYEATMRELDQLERDFRAGAKKVATSAVRDTRAAVHTVATAYHKTVAAAKKAVSATASFVKNHAATIVSIAVGAGTFLGCTALSLGIGAVGCAVLAGAAASGVSYAMSCGKSANGCTATGAIEAIGIGAIGGAVGGALAGPLGGELVSEALDGVFPDIATSAIIGGYSGGGAGAVTGALGYAAGCGSSCSWSGLGSAVASGTEDGVLGGAVAGGVAEALPDMPGVAGCLASSVVSGMAGASVPHSFVGSTPVLMADGSTKQIDQVKVGDKVADAVPGQGGVLDNTVTGVIVTHTDQDFVDVTVVPVKKSGADQTSAQKANNAGGGSHSKPAKRIAIVSTFSRGRCLT